MAKTAPTTMPLNRTKLSRRIYNHRIYYLMLIPPIIGIFIFSYIPLYGISMAFQDFNFRDGYFGSPFVGLKHIIRYVTGANFTRLMKNTVILSLYGFVAGFLTNVIFALMINEMRNVKFRKVAQMISYLPHFISTVVIVSMLTQIFSYYGLANNALAALGLERFSFFNTAKSFRHMYVWSGIWSGVGYGSVLYVSALSSIDTALYEAAEIDGANRLQRIWHINLPGILPTMSIMLILGISGITNVGLEKTQLLQTNVNLSVSQNIAIYSYEVGIVKRQYSYSTAVTLFNSLINICFLLIGNQVSKRLTGTSLF